MSLRDRVARRLGRRLIQAEVESAIADVVARGNALLEAQAEAHLLRLQESIDGDDFLWRPIGERAEQWARSLGTLDHSQITEACFELYKSNPLGHRITEMNRDYVVGDGITFSCLNPNVEDVVADFWHDPDNDLDSRNPQFALELGLYGELLPEVIVTNVAQIVKLDYIDPAQIVRVEHEVVEGRVRALHRDVVRIRDSKYRVNGRPLKIVRTREGKLDGEVFYFAVNAMSNSPRGWPDLLHIADWLDAYDRLMWDITERSRFMRTFLWDVLLDVGSEAEVQAWMRRHGTPPKAGSVRAHTKGETWSAVSPQLGSYETAKEAEVLLEHTAAGAGIPKHWLSSAEDVNRATAAEMGQPSVRKFARRQTEYVNSLKQLLAFVLEKAQEGNRLKGLKDGLMPAYGDDGKPARDRDGQPVMLKPHELVQIHAPEISPKDVSTAGAFLTALANVLVLAEEQNWIGHDPARAAFAQALQTVGFDYDPGSEELEEPEETETEEEPPSREQMAEGVRALVG